MKRKDKNILEKWNMKVRAALKNIDYRKGREAPISIILHIPLYRL